MSSSIPGAAHWPKPNYIDPPDRGTATIVCNTILLVVVIAVVALRYVSRTLVMKQRLGWDDFFIALSLLCTLALSLSVTVANARYGFSRHIWDVVPTNFGPILICDFIAKIAFATAATFTRTSVLCFYSRLVVNSGIKWFRYVLIACHFFVAALCISFVLPMIFQCRPVSAAWSLAALKSAACINEGTVMFAGGIVNTVADALVTIVPIPLILRLRMDKKDQIGVLVLLSLGVFVTLAGIVRTYYIWLALVHSQDSSWFSYPLFVAATVEVDVGIVCACAPTLRPLFAPYFKFLRYTITTTLRSHHNPTATRRSSLGNLTSTSQHSVHNVGKVSYSRNTPSPSKHRIITTQDSLHSLGTSLRDMSSPEPIYSPHRGKEEFDLIALSERSRASLPHSEGSAADTLVPSSITSRTGSFHLNGSPGGKKPSYERDENEISCIKEVCVELGSPGSSTAGSRPTSPMAAFSDRRLLKQLSTGAVPTISSPHDPTSATRQPFKPFSTPTSPPLTHDGSPTPDDDLSTWTRMPSLRFSRPFLPGAAAPAPNFYHPNLSHSQVASAAGYAPPTPNLGDDLERGFRGAGEVGVAQSNFNDVQPNDDDDDEYESDRKYGAGGGRESELIDVMQMFREEQRVRKVEIKPVKKGVVRKL